MDILFFLPKKKPDHQHRSFHRHALCFPPPLFSLQLSLLIANPVQNPGPDAIHPQPVRRAVAVDGPVNRSVAAIADHLPQLPFLGEFLVEQSKVVHELSAGLNQGGARGDGAVGLDAEDELATPRTVRMVSRPGGGGGGVEKGV